MTTIASLSDHVLQAVRAAGADGDLIIDQSESLSLRASRGELEEHKVSTTQVLGLRVIQQGRVGTAYSEATDEAALTALVEQALTNARYAQEDPDEQLADNASELSTDDETLCPPDPRPITDRIADVLRLESELAARDKIRNVPHSGVSQALTQRAIFSTAGLRATSSQRMNLAFAAALAEDGERNAMESYGQARRLSGDIDIDQIIETTWQRSVDMLAGEPISSGSYDVVFDEECQSQLFGVFSMVFSGKTARDGINPWRDKLGQQMADSRLTLVDRPLVSDGFGYARFDAEGTATQDLVVLDGGRLTTLLHNSATARYFGLDSTGHATRGPKSTLGVSAHQWELVAGDSPVFELLAGEYLEITDLTGLHSGANAISGDFSFGASGFLCRDGERQRAVRGITVAGNFYQMLNRIAAVGDTLHWNWRRTTQMPSIRFAAVAVSG